MKKTIGIVGYSHSKEDFFGASETYLRWISEFGNVRILMPWEEIVDIDMLILPGGLDISPSSYGQTPGFGTSNTDVHKEHFFKHKLKGYVEKGIPILGICLGMQQLSVYFGATLEQDMLFHPQSAARWSEAHPVLEWGFSKKKGEGYYPAKINGVDFKVNSHHHQALLVNDLDFNVFEPKYFSQYEKGYIVEAFKIVDRPIYGVQWHPEELYDKYTYQLMHELLK